MSRQLTASKPKAQEDHQANNSSRNNSEIVTSNAQTEACPDCNGDVKQDTKRGETVCTVCGLVVTADNVNPGPDWHDYGDTGETKSRVGSPDTLTQHDRGLGTEISNFQFSGGYSSSRRRQLYRMQKFHKRSRCRNKKERNLREALGEIKRMNGSLGFPKSVSEAAAKLYRTASKDGLIQGRSIEAMASAAICIAARQFNYPRTIKKIASVSRVEEGRIRNACKVFNRELSIGIPIATPLEYFPRIASDLDLTEQHRQAARTLLERVTELQISVGHHPHSIVCGCVYLTGQFFDDSISQIDLANVSDIQPDTLRGFSGELIEEADWTWILDAYPR